MMHYQHIQFLVIPIGNEFVHPLLIQGASQFKQSQEDGSAVGQVLG